MTDSPYVPWRDVEHYLNHGQAAAIPLSHGPAHPAVTYVVGHGGRDIALHVELAPRHRPPASPLPAVRIDQISERGRRLARISTTQTALMRDFHDLLSAVADRIVTHQRSLDQAFAETVRAWSSLLDRPGSLSLEKRIGLMGELATMRGLAGAYGWDTAVTAWTGPQREEHDFGLPEFDLEVKTTAAEERRHTIHGAGQLEPVPGRPLWFLSLQVTRGGVHGRTLAECVQAVQGEVRDQAPAFADRLDSGIAAAGWSDESPDDERWSLRSAPLALDAAVLPRLDSNTFTELARERVSALQYAVDVTGLLPALEPPPALLDIRLP